MTLTFEAEEVWYGHATSLGGLIVALYTDEWGNNRNDGGRIREAHREAAMLLLSTLNASGWTLATRSDWNYEIVVVRESDGARYDIDTIRL
jgi:hypothetical protein